MNRGSVIELPRAAETAGLAPESILQLRECLFCDSGFCSPCRGSGSHVVPHLGETVDAELAVNPQAVP